VYLPLKDCQLAWITGANGLMGNYLVQTAPRLAPRWRVIGLVRDGNLPSLPHAGRDAVSASPISSENVRCLDLTDFDAARRALHGLAIPKSRQIFRARNLLISVCLGTAERRLAAGLPRRE
jgi:nucleoside-diphosphate-sugar epimerase